MENNGGMLTGSIRALMLFDVAEEIDLIHFRRLLGTSPAKREPAFRHPAPQYVRFERAPVVENLGSCDHFQGRPLSGRIRYFDYGVASVELQVQFQASWDELVLLANSWISSPELEGRAQALLRERLAPLSDGLKKVYGDWISEDYYVVHVDSMVEREAAGYTAEDLLRRHGPQIAQIVRGEDSPLSSRERQEVLQSSMSYYPMDLLVVGWVAAFV